MPEVQEVFRMATNKVKPDPNALERQVRRQRKTTRNNRARTYVVVAAVLAAVAIGVFALQRSTGDATVPGSDRSPAPSSFTTSLPGGAQRAKPSNVSLNGSVLSIAGLPPDAYSLSYSPHVGRIAFIAVDDTGVDRLGYMNVDGTVYLVPTPTNLIIGSTIGIGTAAISPDGTRIAFEALSSRNSDIYVVGIDGSGLVRLTDDPQTDQYPQWSPDNSTIVYDNGGAREQSSDPQFSQTAEIYTVPADGSASPTRLTHDDVANAAPSFSPDGRRLAFVRDNQIWTMSADGTDPQQLTDGAMAFTPRWSPDGSTIAFTYYSHAYRPVVAMASEYGDRPLIIAALVDVATGEVTRLRDIAMASDANTPQWLDADRLLISRVRAR